VYRQNGQVRRNRHIIGRIGRLLCWLLLLFLLQLSLLLLFLLLRLGLLLYLLALRPVSVAST
jgi:hypothetical protein